MQEKLQVLNEVVECVQQEVRRSFYGYNNPGNFGLLPIETVVPRRAPLEVDENGTAHRATESSSMVS